MLVDLLRVEGVGVRRSRPSGLRIAIQASDHTTGNSGIFGLSAPVNPLAYPQEPPHLPTVLPTAGRMGYSRITYSRNPVEVRCVVVL